MANPYFLSWQEVTDQILSFLPPSWRANFSGKVLKRLIVAYAVATEALYALLARLLRLAIIASSEGEWLRSLVAGMGMDTFSGTAASVSVRFRRFSGFDTPLQIPQGTQVGSLYGQIFATTQNAVLPVVTDPAVVDQFVDVPCLCTEAGAIGNVRAGEIVSLVTGLTGIDQVFNPNPAFGGTDPESDAEIKARLPKHIESLHRGTIPATEYVVGIDRQRFPEVQGFLTQRNYGNPGYFRGILSDYSGGDLYRPTDWVAIGTLGVYFVPCALDEVNGLVAAGWPCKRFGVLTRTTDGEEQWLPSSFVSEVEAGTWRFCLDTSQQRLYAKADGSDLNNYQITIYSGVVWRALRELELNWAANGVSLDILVPFTVQGSVALTYSLEPGYTQTTVESSIRNTVSDYVKGLGLGQDFELESLYAALSTVPGAGGVLVTAPTGNVAVPTDSVFRLSGPTGISRRAE